VTPVRGTPQPLAAVGPVEPNDEADDWRGACTVLQTTRANPESRYKGRPATSRAPVPNRIDKADLQVPGGRSRPGPDTYGPAALDLGHGLVTPMAGDGVETAEPATMRDSDGTPRSAGIFPLRTGQLRAAPATSAGGGADAHSFIRPAIVKRGGMANFFSGNIPAAAAVCLCNIRRSCRPGGRAARNAPAVNQPGAWVQSKATGQKLPRERRW